MNLSKKTIPIGIHKRFIPTHSLPIAAERVVHPFALRLARATSLCGSALCRALGEEMPRRRSSRRGEVESDMGNHSLPEIHELETFGVWTI